MDIRMPTVDGLTAIQRLRVREDAPQVVVPTTFHAGEHVLRALRAGAAGFVVKDTPPAQIVDAVRRVAAGAPVLSPAVTRRLMAHAAGTAADTRRARARERVAALGEAKLGLNNRVQIALPAYDAGLLEDGDRRRTRRQGRALGGRPGRWSGDGRGTRWVKT